jgi:capsular exopolysaccharide synthesis family protein
MPQEININQEQITNNRADPGNLSIKDLFYKYARFFPVIVLSVALALLVAWIYLRYATRIYSATGTMAIQSTSTDRSQDRVEDIIAGTNRSQNLVNEIEVLKSRPLMIRVVKKLNLQFSYTSKGKVIDLNIYKRSPFLIKAFELTDSFRTFTLEVKFINSQQFRLDNDTSVFTLGQVFRNRYGVFQLVQNGIPPPGKEYSVTWQPAAAVAGGLVGSLSVLPKIQGTGILTISIQSTNAQMAADIVNGLMAEYDSMTVEQNNFSTDQMLSFIDGRLAILNHELDTVQLRLLEYQQKNNLMGVELQSTGYFQRITSADNAVNVQQMNLDIADMVDEYLKNKSNEYSKVVVPSSLGLADATLNELVSSYNKVQLDRQALLDANVPPENPVVKQAEGQIETIRQSVLENLENIKLANRDAIGTLKNRSTTEQSEWQALPYKLKEYVELQRQVNTKLGLYSLLQGKKEEAAISRAATVSNSKVIEEARISGAPIKPNSKMIRVIAVLIGLALPALIIFISEVLNDKITTRFDIEKVTQTPILGEIGHSFSDNALIVNKTSRSMVSEQFRIVRSNLQYVLHKEKAVILVTSSFSGEGKSFISTNMGAVLALAGKKTIIVEFDIRKPKVLSGLNIARRPGITNFLLGKAELEELITPVPDQENLFVLACGPIPPNPSEMLLDQKVTELFSKLRERFDIIIVDTAPVGMVSDALTLSKFADCTLYLVRQGHTFKKQIGLIDEFYRENKLPGVSIIINDVKLKSGYGYYGYGRYGYGYGYGYGSYYEEEKPPLSFFENILDRLDIRKWFRRRK